jgi:hypothetical protein
VTSLDDVSLLDDALTRVRWGPMHDDVLRALGRHQREQLDERSPEPLDELRRPFDDVTREALIDQALARGDPGSVIRLSRRRVAVLLLASAAALALVFQKFNRSGSRFDRERAIAMLPEYSSQLRGGRARQRGGGDSDLTLAASDEIDWLLTPAEPVRQAIGVVLIAEADHARARFVPRPDAHVAESGVIRLRTRLELEPGEWTLTLVIAAPSDLPNNLEDARAAEGPWQRVSVRVTIVAER